MYTRRSYRPYKRYRTTKRVYGKLSFRRSPFLRRLFGRRKYRYSKKKAIKRKRNFAKRVTKVINADRALQTSFVYEPAILDTTTAGVQVFDYTDIGATADLANLLTIKAAQSITGISGRANVQMKSIGLAPYYLTLYHLVLKKDLPAAEVSPLTVLSNGSNDLGYINYYQLPEVEPTDIPRFNLYFKVIKKTVILMSQGKCHRELLYKKWNKEIEVQEFKTTDTIYRKEFAKVLLWKMVSCPMVTTAETAATSTYGRSAQCDLVMRFYKYTQSGLAEYNVTNDSTGAVVPPTSVTGLLGISPAGISIANPNYSVQNQTYDAQTSVI